MAIQLTDAISTGNSCMLSSYPSIGLPNTYQPLTVMAWLNNNSWTTTIRSIIGMYDGTTSNATSAIQIGTRGNGAVDIWTWGGGLLISSIGGVPPVNEWLHIAYTCNQFVGGQTHNLYINGVLNNSVTNSVQINADMTQVYINGYPQNSLITGSETSDVIIDDYNIYNRQLLEKEIKTIYTLKGNTDAILYGLQGRYLFNDNVKNTLISNNSDNIAIYDNSKNKFNLTLYKFGNGLEPSFVNGYTDNDTRMVL